MKKWFVVGVLGLIAFEIANVYFIMPLPYSQRVRSIDVAFALYSWRWVVRAASVALMVLGVRSLWRVTGWRRWSAPLAVGIAAVVAYVTNFQMAADKMFLIPEQLTMVPSSASAVEKNRLVVGVFLNGEARAYPVQFLGYHHQVRDRIGGEPILVTFCTVCRTGRVFSPMIDSIEERFRLVGMDHFNAMFEDATTHSWWRQANGEAVIGPMKGTAMPELPTVQVSLKQWIKLHPETLVMQADPAFTAEYSKDYEIGRAHV